MIFKQGKNTPLNQNPGTLPDLSGALDGWLIKMTFIKLAKSTVNFKTVEVQTPIEFEGCWQGTPAHVLALKPEGQRSWKWYDCYTKTNLDLNPDEIISYLGVNYRVKSENDFSLHGIKIYSLVEDFTT